MAETYQRTQQGELEVTDTSVKGVFNLAALNREKKQIENQIAVFEASYVRQSASLNSKLRLINERITKALELNVN